MPHAPHPRPPLAGNDLQYCVEELDKLIARRPPQPVFLPLIFVQDKSGSGVADQVVRDYPTRFVRSVETEERETGTGKPSLPYALVSRRVQEQAGDDDRLMLQKIADQLSGNMPRAMGRLSLRNFHALRQVLAMPPLAAPDYPGRVDELRDRLFKAWLEQHSWLKWLGGGLVQLKAGAGVVSATWSVNPLKLIAQPISRLYGRWLMRGGGFAWFNQEAERLVGPSYFTRDFLHSAVSLHDDGSLHDYSLLTMALVEDLRAGVRPGWLSVRRARRTTPFALFFESVEPDGPAARFLERFAHLTKETGNNVVIVIASADKHLPGGWTGAEKLDPGEAGHLFASLKRGRFTADPLRSLILDLSMVNSTELGGWLTRRPPVTPKRGGGDVRRARLARSLVALVVLTLVGLPLYRLTHQESQCSYLPRTGDETIGIIGDQPQNTHCTFFASHSRDNDKAKEQKQAFRDVQQRILAQNEAVDDSLAPYRTVVFVAPLTVLSSTEGNQSALWELQGIAAAQRDFNTNAPPPNDHPYKLKILLANAGNDLKYGQEVAWQIGRFSQGQDQFGRKSRGIQSQQWNVIGVAGVTQSRAVARDMLGILTNEPYSLAVVGSTPTGDDMTNPAEFPLAYMVSAGNTRQAQVSAEFARHQPLFSDKTKPAGGVVIITDDRDEYSYNLASKFLHAYGETSDAEGRRIIKVLNYHLQSSAQASPTADRLVDDTVEDAQVSNKQFPSRGDSPLGAEGVAKELCNAKTETGAFSPNRDLVYYAARATNFNSLMKAVSQRCPRGNLTILGSSDMGKFSDYGDPQERAFLKDHLYHVAFVSDKTDIGLDADLDVSHTVLTSYKSLPVAEGGGQGQFVNENDFARAYDAFMVYGEVTDRLWAVDRTAFPAPASLYSPWDYARASWSWITRGLARLHLWPQPPAKTHALKDKPHDSRPVNARTVADYLLGSSIEFNGVSGRIQLGGELRRPIGKPVLIMKTGVDPEAHGEDSQIMMSCGTFYKDDTQERTLSRWGERGQFACP